MDCVKRSDICLDEETLDERTLEGVDFDYVVWTASVTYAALTETGTRVSLSRSGVRASDALATLEAALRGQGWGIA